ncbi:MAG: S41 family peptidase [Mogibacterium sp.]|nr:S41 family peptidase [Mogibacterium sp.]
MMHEDLIKEINEDKKLGLDLSDTAYYNVDDGVTDEPLLVDVSESEEEAPLPKTRLGLLFSFLLGIIACLAVIVLCVQVFGVGHFVSDNTYDYYIDLDKSCSKYYEIMKMIGEDPIAQTEPEELSDEQLKNLVNSIGDPYAAYYTAAEYAELEKRYMGDYVGIGIGVVEEDGKVVIKSVFANTPAEEAGLQVDDVILKVEGKAPADVDEAVQMISGEAGTKVKITIGRGDDTFDYELSRQKIDTDSVAYSKLEEYPEIGYILISSFITGTDDEFKMAVKDLKAKGCTKFILDLRDNGGGLTESSIEIADYLLPACKIMSENTKDGSETVYNSDASSADLDMVILVNGNTASASEILTAALQDNNAGVVIGTKTYGKGVTQVMHKFSDGTAVKLTVTEYFRPSGETVNGIGITPDIEAEGEEVLEEAFKELTE